MFILSKEGVQSLIVKLNDSETEEQFMRHMYLVCLICLETPKELKVKVIRQIDILPLLDRIRISDMKVINQKKLLSYVIEM